MSMIQTDNLIFEYIRRDEEGNVESITKALDGVSMEIKKGDFVAILGHNGSGKSTLAKHINAILLPTEGALYVGGDGYQGGSAPLGYPPDGGYGFSESGQPDHSNGRGGGRGIRTGEPRRADAGNMETRGGEFKGGWDV